MKLRPLLLYLAGLVVAADCFSKELDQQSADALISEITTHQEQEIDARGRERILKILKAKGAQCSRIEASKSYPSGGKLGFVLACPEGGYALFWKNGRTILYRQ